MHYSGPAALAVYGMMSTAVALFLGIFFGVSEAAQPIVSVNFGAGNRERYQSVGKLGVKTAAAFGLVCLALCALFPSHTNAKLSWTVCNTVLICLRSFIDEKGRWCICISGLFGAM